MSKIHVYCQSENGIEIKQSFPNTINGNNRANKLRKQLAASGLVASIKRK